MQEQRKQRPIFQYRPVASYFAGSWWAAQSCVMSFGAVGPAAEIHTRMPIALPKDAEVAWLDPGMTDAAAAIESARGFSVTDIVYHPVNPRVNNARNEGAELIEPIENPV
jgi:putative SOS response-associated peptidase YedK